MNTRCIGIDFGTTKTLVAYHTEHNHKPEIAHLGRERNSVPTSAFIGEGGTWEFGDDADDYACDAAMADRYVSKFKLKLGSTSPVLQLLSQGTFQSFSARDIATKYLRHIRSTCEKEVFNGHAVSEAVITHPVHFSPAQIADLRCAAEQAGFSSVKLISEPKAAGLAFCRLCPKDVFNGTALVVDWGGGTLDLALVSREGDSITVHDKYVAGSDTIGGVVFDELLWKHVAARLQQEHGVSPAEDRKDLIRLQKKKVMAAKEKLSRTETAMVSISGNQGAYPTLKISRAELERTIQPYVQAGIEGIQNLLSGIREQSLRPTQVLLIGGSSQIPLISKLIEDTTGLPCRRWQYSNEAVTLGATICMTDTISNVETASAVSLTAPAVVKQSSHSTEEKRSYCRQSADYLYGINGKPFNPQKSLALLKKGAAMGEACCLLDLASFYKEGCYVPYNPAKARQYMLQAVSKGSKVALASLFVENLDEHANPLDAAQKEKILPGLIAELSIPNSVDDDDIRYMWISELLLDSADYDRALSFCSKIKDHDLREISETYAIGLKGIFAFFNEEYSEENRFNHLKKGVQALKTFVDKPCCLTGVCAALLHTIHENENSPIYSPEESLKHLQISAEFGNVENCILSILKRLDNSQESEQEIQRIAERIDTLSRMGLYAKPDDDALPGVTIHLQRPELGSLHEILPDETVRYAVAQNEEVFSSLYSAFGPAIIIENTSRHALCNLLLSLRCNSGIFTYTIPRINAGETLSFDPGLRELESWPALPESGELEVRAGDKSCFLNITGPYHSIMVPSPLCPLLVTWQVGFWGGKRLHIQNVSDNSVQGIVQKLKNQVRVNISLDPGEIVEIGWTDFPDKESVELEEALLFQIEQFYPMVGIVRGESDEAAGWKKTAGWIGGALALALGAS